MSQLEYLVITGNNITFLKTNSFIYLQHLYFLNLEANNISNLESGTSSGLLNLRYLYLAGKNIIFLKANIFKGMRTSGNCGTITFLLFGRFLQNIDYLVSIAHLHTLM